MSKWEQYQNFSELAKKVGGPNNLMFIVITASITLGALATLSINKYINKKKKLHSKEQILSSIKNYQNGSLDLKEGDIITVGSIDDDIALIKVNDSNEPYYVSYSELLKITKKVERK